MLYGNLSRDILLSLATAGLYHARWTTKIHQEWSSHLGNNRPELAQKIPLLIQQINASVPDCLVENYEYLIDTLTLPDANDRHILAAAIVGHADAIVTENLKHFPADVLAVHGLEAQHPDDFIMNQLELRPFEALAAIRKMRERKIAPAISASELIGLIEKRGLPHPKIKATLPAHRVGTMINNIQRAIVLNTLPPLPNGINADDLNDAFLLAMSLAGEANYLVTGDRRAGLLQRGSIGRTRIVTPSTFCAEAL